jgi:hypothetical protein
MFDINTAINTAIAAAVAEATKPLIERIAALETKLAEAALFERTTEVTVPVDEVRMVEALNSQEWFWEKVGHFVGEAVARHEDDAPHIGHLFIDQKIEAAIDAHLENANHLDEDDIGDAIDTAIEKHEEDSTHGDEDNIERLVRKMLRSASISIDL